MGIKKVRKGTYCLLIHQKANEKIVIGQEGKLSFDKGYYVYIGSAMNSLEGRIQRHLSKYKKLHWHVDYLLDNPQSSINKVYFSDDEVKHECDLAKSIAENGKEVQGFGCSDCKCNSHLIYFLNIDDAEYAVSNAFKEMGLERKKICHLKNFPKKINGH